MVVATVSLIDNLVTYVLGSLGYLPELGVLIYKRTPDVTQVVITKEMVQNLINQARINSFPRESVISQLTTVLCSSHIFHWRIAKKLQPLE